MSDIRANVPGVFHGVRLGMNEAAKTVMNNMMLAAFARIMLVGGTPIIIGLLAWFAGSFVALQQLVAIQASEQARLVSEVRELQDYRREAYARGTGLTKDVAIIKEMLDRMQKTLDARGRP
jgi:hypothetical protein